MKKNKSLIFFLIVCVITAVFGLLLKPGDELLYTVVAQYLLLPLLILILSAISVKKGTFLGFVCPFIYVALTLLLPIIPLGKTDIAFLAFAVVPAVIGTITGIIALIVKKTKKAKKEIEEKEVPLHA